MYALKTYGFSSWMKEQSIDEKYWLKKLYYVEINHDDYITDKPFLEYIRTRVMLSEQNQSI